MSVFSPIYLLKIIKIRRRVRIFKKKKILLAFVSLLMILTISLVVLSQMNILKFSLRYNFSKEKIRIGHMEKPENMLYYLADDLGYFEEEGIQAELVPFSNDEDGISSILAGEIDTGSFKSIEVIKAMDLGEEIRIHGGGIQHGYGLFTLSENASEYDLIENYNEKTIGVLKDSLGKVILKDAIDKVNRSENLNIAEFDTYIELLKALNNKELASGVFALSDLGLADRENLRLAIGSVDLFKKHPSYSQVAKTSLLKDEKGEKIFIRYNRALIKAYKYYIEYPRETIDIILKYVDVDRDLLRGDIYDENQEANWDSFWPNPNPNREYNEKFIKTLEGQRYLRAENNEKRRYIYDAIYFKAMNELAKETNDPIYKKLQRQFLC